MHKNEYNAKRNPYQGGLIKSKSQSCSYWLHWLIAQAQQPPFPNQLASGCWKCLAVTGGGLVAKSVLQSKTSLKWCQSPTDFCGSPTFAIYSELCWNCDFPNTPFLLRNECLQVICELWGLSHLVISSNHSPTSGCWWLQYKYFLSTHCAQIWSNVLNQLGKKKPHKGPDFSHWTTPLIIHKQRCLFINWAITPDIPSVRPQIRSSCSHAKDVFLGCKWLMRAQKVKQLMKSLSRCCLAVVREIISNNNQRR